MRLSVLSKLFGKSLLLLFAISFLPACESETEEIRVGSFNIWMNTTGGKLPVAETAKVIRVSKADVIGIQEGFAFEEDGVVHDHVPEIAEELGFYMFNQRDGCYILSRYPVVDSTKTRSGVKVELAEGQYCWMFNCHLFHMPYQPYQLNDRVYGDFPFISTEVEAIKFARETRQREVDIYKEEILGCMKSGYPVFLTGDFNEPSCLDWTKRAAEAGLHKIKVEWPSAKSFLDMGLRDSFREVFPDEVANPGITWNAVPVEDEINDRLDFVLYSGCQALQSVIIGENESTSDVVVTPYPSDHRMVTSLFNIKRP